jgi:hypothetical protein
VSTGLKPPHGAVAAEDRLSSTLGTVRLSAEATPKPTKEKRLNTLRSYVFPKGSMHPHVCGPQLDLRLTSTTEL